MKTVDLFAGAGGASLGLRDAGYEHLACIEWDEDAAATLDLAGFPAIHGDVRDLRLVRDLKPDLVWSSFPCQDWSTAGRPHTLEEPAPTINGRGNQMLRVIGGGSNPRSPEEADNRTYRDPADEPCTTIPANQIGNARPWIVEYARGRDDGTRYERHSADEPACAPRGSSGGSTHPFVSNEVHPPTPDAPFLGTSRRRLTVEECAKLQDFPDGHPFQGTKTERYRQVGNAVPPRMAEVVARAVMESDEKLKRSSS